MRGCKGETQDDERRLFRRRSAKAKLGSELTDEGEVTASIEVAGIDNSLSLSLYPSLSLSVCVCAIYLYLFNSS